MKCAQSGLDRFVQRGLRVLEARELLVGGEVGNGGGVVLEGEEVLLMRLGVRKMLRELSRVAHGNTKRRRQDSP